MNVQLVLQVAMLTPTVSTSLEATDVSVMLATPLWVESAWVSQGNRLTGMCPLSGYSRGCLIGFWLTSSLLTLGI